MAVTSATSDTSFRMTGGRRAALFAGVPVCLALVVSLAFSLVADVGEGRYPVHYTAPAGTRALTLNVTGKLTIRPAAAGQATLSGTAVYSLARSKVTESTTSAGTTIGYHCPLPLGNCELDATVTVPPTVTALTANSGAGDATVNGTTGPVKLSTGDGNLSVSHASGPLTLNTGSGGIQVSAISKSATLSASSGDGSIQAAGVTSTTITANTDSGSITGSGIATDTITASSGDGSIEIRFSSIPGNVRVNTDSGNITLVLPPGHTEYHVTANTDSGVVDDTLPTNQRNDSAPHTITATSGSGNITISQQ
jgi:Putative adhesin